MVYNNVTFGQKTFIPADLDVLIYFAPVRNHSNNTIGKSYRGYFDLTAKYSLTNSSEIVLNPLEEPK